MGVYIPDMEMPKTCANCDFVEPIGLMCTRIHKFLDREDYRYERDKDCPLVEVPEHGRLIDADKVKNEHSDFDYLYVIDDAQTIIEANWSENE